MSSLKNHPRTTLLALSLVLGVCYEFRRLARRRARIRLALAGATGCR